MILAVVVALLFIKQLDTMAAKEDLHRVFRLFDQINVFGEDKQCVLVAHSFRNKLNPRYLYISLRDALKLSYPNIDVSFSSDLTSAEYDDRDDLNTGFYTQDYIVPFETEYRKRFRWKVTSCTTACKDAVTEVCDNYNCTNIEEKYKTYCSEYCEDMYC